MFKTVFFFDDLESVIKEKQLLAHQARNTYLDVQVQANLLKLDRDGAVLTKCLFYQKLLEKLIRIFWQKGWTLHSILIYTK